eukprot:scaffold3213_cov66-Phaeocystis_antarctica.AAC.2
MPSGRPSLEQHRVAAQRAGLGLLRQVRLAVAERAHAHRHLGRLDDGRDLRAEEAHQVGAAQGDGLDVVEEDGAHLALGGDGGREALLRPAPVAAVHLDERALGVRPRHDVQLDLGPQRVELIPQHAEEAADELLRQHAPHCVRLWVLQQPLSVPVALELGRGHPQHQRRRVLLGWPRQVQRVFIAHRVRELRNRRRVSAHGEAGALAQPLAEEVGRLGLTQLLLQHLLVHGEREEELAKVAAVRVQLAIGRPAVDARKGRRLHRHPLDLVSGTNEADEVVGGDRLVGRRVDGGLGELLGGDRPSECRSALRQLCGRLDLLLLGLQIHGARGRHLRGLELGEDRTLLVRPRLWAQQQHRRWVGAGPAGGIDACAVGLAVHHHGAHCAVLTRTPRCPPEEQQMWSQDHRNGGWPEKERFFFENAPCACTARVHTE